MAEKLGLIDTDNLKQMAEAMRSGKFSQGDRIRVATLSEALLAENAALREEKDRIGRTLMTMQEAIPSAYHPNGSGLRLFIADLRARATEAERKLTEAVRIFQQIEKHHGIECIPDNEIQAGIRAFLSEEAERG